MQGAGVGRGLISDKKLGTPMLDKEWVGARSEGAVSAESHSGIESYSRRDKSLAGLAGVCSGFWLLARQVPFEGEEVGRP